VTTSMPRWEGVVVKHCEHGYRARSADQRAAGVAAIASLAASFALAGAALVLDKDKLREPFFIRPAFGIVLCIAVAAFIVAAVMAAITHTSQHDDAVDESKSSQNWAAARRKHTHMTRSLWALAVGMFFVLVLSGISIFVPPPP
jgi:hypothetical protein